MNVIVSHSSFISNVILKKLVNEINSKITDDEWFQLGSSIPNNQAYLIRYTFKDRKLIKGSFINFIDPPPVSQIDIYSTAFGYEEMFKKVGLNLNNRDMDLFTSCEYTKEDVINYVYSTIFDATVKKQKSLHQEYDNEECLAS